MVQSREVDLQPYMSSMRQSAQDAREKGRIANDKFFDELHKACEEAKQRSKFTNNSRSKDFYK